MMNNADMPAMPTLLKCGDAAKSEGGLTKREYFAGLALQGLMASGCQADTPTAKEALCAADCLLHELEKEGRS